MRTLGISFLCLVGELLPAQQEREAASRPDEQLSASARFEELARLHAARIKGAVPYMARQHPDYEANQKKLQEGPRARAQDLQSFLEQFPRGPESIRARLEIAKIAVTDDRFAKTGTKVLEELEVPEVDLPDLLQFMAVAGQLGVKTEGWVPHVVQKVGKADVRTTFQAATMAPQMGLEDKKDEWVKQAVAKVATTDDRLLAARMLKVRFGDEDGFQRLLVEADKAARSPDDRARILMEKAAIARAGKRGEEGEDEARAILQEIVNLYPSSPSAQIAKGQLEITAITVGSEPIPFLTRDLSGKDVSTAGYKGKVLLIEFWATWCGPCMAEMPNVMSIYDQYHAQGFEILGISLDREADREKLEACLAERKIEWPQVFDGGQWSAEVARLYGVKGIPYTVLVGRDGKVIATNLRGANLGKEVKLAVEAPR